MEKRENAYPRKIDIFIKVIPFGLSSYFKPVAIPANQRWREVAKDKDEKRGANWCAEYANLP